MSGVRFHWGLECTNPVSVWPPRGSYFSCRLL